MLFNEIKEKIITPKAIVILALVLFFISCMFFNIHILYVDKTGYYKSPQAYELYVLKQYFLFIYIVALIFLINMNSCLRKKTYSLDDIGKIVLYSYGFLSVFILTKIIYIIIMPSKTSSAVSFLMPPVLYDILKGLGDVHIFYFFAFLPFSLFLFNSIVKLLLKYSNPLVCFIVSNALLIVGINLFAKFCIYCDSVFDVLH